MWAKMKSAKPLSGEMPSKVLLFCGLTWSLRQTPRMKEPTHEMNPDRKALKGKVPTRQQYKNWITPVRNTYVRYASMIFRRLGVLCVYL